MSNIPWCLRPVLNGTATLAACSGNRRVSEATAVFGYVDRDFVRWGADGPTADAAKTTFCVYELVDDSDLAEVFTDSAFFTPSQLVQFCNDHRAMLSQGATLVPIECDGKFVCGVRTYGESLMVLIHRFPGDRPLLKECGYRIVRPRAH